ncbi:MAG: phosphoribosyltransferase [Eubacteriaceae bacterium]|jgi:ATP phosphoribosyltransferase|nr:phosphoribosyltransferase [Eubacteriaceae bacterium]MDK2904230.1 phosphoribosyltransferase [Eubacteriaceae bacterium]MDK2935593.1 phosphoribosyltransferase [Eubacteriaceae bacterium]MDK2961258.1 phosphoribosyltransferase [Eubacteriaceae bacterium]MDN5306737.1 phosphoribosyltransferase [Eubacteriaceae bacterium]
MTIRFALAKGRVAKKAIALLIELGYVFDDYSEKSRKLIFQDTTGAIAFFLVKSPDVATYVEKGAADIGIVGKDVLLEHPAKVYEMLNLNIGKCRMCVAGYPDRPLPYGKKLVVGTKYPVIAKNFFQTKKQLVDIIKLNGSVELAPIIGLSDCIVDIVESGSTLKENGLAVLEEICQISSRLIVNQVSLKTKRTSIDPIIKAFETQLTTDV